MILKSLLKNIVYCVAKTFDAIKFWCYRQGERRLYKHYEFPYKPTYKGKTAYILANGPSLKTELSDLLAKDINLQESLVVNFFVETDLFTQIRPKYYCLADPMFFKEDILSDRVLGVFELLNDTVQWPMTLFVWKSGESFLPRYIQNPNIKIVGLSILLYGGFERNRYKCYRKGTAVPSYVNVTIMALYALLNLGYSKIYLYGVDHSFLAGLGVNDNNRLCMVDKHFYGIEKYEFGPDVYGKICTMKDFVYDKYLTFAEHERMRGYADFLGAEIINCTKDSWIDAYTRLAQIEKKDNQQ